MSQAMILNGMLHSDEYTSQPAHNHVSASIDIPIRHQKYSVRVRILCLIIDNGFIFCVRNQ